MQKTVTKNEVENMLGNRESLLTELEEKERRLEQKIIDEESIISQVSLPNPMVSILYDSVCDNGFEDLYDVVEKYKTVSNKLKDVINHELEDIINEKETVQRVYLCFEAIRGSGKYYTLLRDNVINGIPLTQLMDKYNRSMNVIYLWKRKALNMIIDIYERKDITNKMLAEMVRDRRE